MNIRTTNQSICDDCIRAHHRGVAVASSRGASRPANSAESHPAQSLQSSLTISHNPYQGCPGLRTAVPGQECTSEAEVEASDRFGRPHHRGCERHLPVPPPSTDYLTPLGLGPPLVHLGP